MTKHRYKNPFWRSAIACLVLVIAVEAWAIVRPLPAALPQALSLKVPATNAVGLPWPTGGQAALGAQGYGLLATNGPQTATPIASVAKVITALAVLNQKPLALNQPGPTITLTQADVDIYQSFLAQGQSVVAVSIGEQISEYQALQAMLLPSANNMAVLLTTWAFGSVDNFIAYTNNLLKELGLSSTHMADASGFSPDTVSSASDMMKVALAAMNDPVIAQIVSQTQVQVPVTGLIRNTNLLLGTDGIVGIKTGNTDQAGGCFLFAAQHTIDGQSIQIVGVVLNAPTLSASMNQAKALVEAIDQAFALIKSIKAGQAVGTYKTVWGAKTNAVAKNDLVALVWSGSPASLKTDLKPLKPGTKAGSAVGSLKLTSTAYSVSVPLVTSNTLASPSLSWRLLHP